MAAADFQNEPLQDMVALGAAGPSWARLWLRSERPGRVRIQWWPEDEPASDRTQEIAVSGAGGRDQTTSVRIPAPGAPGAPGLDPLRGYRYRAVHLEGGHLLGEGRLETAPASPETTPRRFSIGFFSCHQPFDAGGRVTEDAEQMLRAAGRCLEQNEAKLVLELGDQMYSDLPARLSLFDREHFRSVAPHGRTRLQDCTVEEVRRLYQRRYRHFWNLAGWRALHARIPCYPILDDHDIIDNWGSDPAHRGPEWQAIGTGARLAYLDYQGTRILDPDAGLPGSFHHAFGYGHTGVFVMDLRSERRGGNGARLYSDRQAGALEAFLEASAGQALILIVLSVPVIHLPRCLVSVVSRLPPSDEDFTDRWSSAGHLRDRDRFLRTIHRHQLRNPAQRVVLVSGDIHIGCAHRIHWQDEGPALYQVISSAITHRSSLLVEQASKLIIRANRRVVTADGALAADVRLLGGAGQEAENPCGGCNLGLIEVRSDGEWEGPRIRFLHFGHRGGEPVCLYRSPFV